MLNFFRRLRKPLLATGQIRKYVIYALGEILLVMVGILLALQVNNWNQNNLQRLEEKRVLEAIRADFHETQVIFTETIKKQTKVVDYTTILIQVMYNNHDHISADSLGSLLYFGVLGFWRAEAVTGAYDALIGSGKTSLIQDEEIGRLLAEFSSEMRFGFEDFDYSMDLIDRLTGSVSNYQAVFFQNKLAEDLDIPKRHEEPKALIQKFLRDSEVLGVLIEKRAIEINRLDRQKNLFEDTENILSLLDEILNDS